MFDFILVALAITIAVSIYGKTIQNKSNSGKSFIYLFSAAVFLAACSNFYIYHPAFLPNRAWIALFDLFIKISFSSFLLYVLKTGNSKWPLSIIGALLFIEPILSQVLSISNTGDVFLQLSQVNGIYIPQNFDQPWFVVNILYNNILLFGVWFLLARKSNIQPVSGKNSSQYLLVGTTFAIIFNSFIRLPGLLTPVNLQLVSLMCVGLSMMIGLDESPIITRDFLVENMRDGWIILDTQNHVIDINKAAENIIGLNRRQLHGQSAEKIFIDWPNLTNSLEDSGILELKGSAKINDEWVFLNINISPLRDDMNQIVGKLILWRDITERRLADEARQQARDEMFLLLHSITSAASRALNLDDFLSESIYQIVYSSRSQSIAVYLLDDNDFSSEERNLILAAQHGMSITPGSQASILPISSEIVSTTFEQGEPLLIPNINKDNRTPDVFLSIGAVSLLLIPMMVENQALGLIALTRSNTPLYNADEVARLVTVADEMAAFIYSNRQRQLSIALAERQRLVRDLHDSVTQKLYGLVTLSEATQAGIKAGATDMPAKVIGKIAENARQALKEMRLFLFQMQPVNFEHDGLISVLQQRLSAVEGRADINAKLIADDDISLPLEKELALYFISQEALNNIIKHAKARNVNIFLKNMKNNYILQIEDDGCGFDLLDMDTGGIGLRSIRERTDLIGGKLSIITSPGNGTKISITIAKY